MISILAAAVMAIGVAANAQEIDWKKVDAALGRTAAVAGDVHRYGFPRSDLHVTLDGVAIKPALALGGWVAFKPGHDGTMMMGDVEPLTFYMHLSGHGDPVKLATALHMALAASKTPLATPAAAAPAPAVDLDTAQLDGIIGVKGKAVGGVYQFGVPRREQVTQNGMPLTPAGPLGVATGINFQPTGNGKAAITGDFVLAAREVNPVIRALRANGIEVTALHSHMLDEQPRLFFMHFWANDDAIKLAKGVRAALDKTATAESVGVGTEPKQAH
jgi:hypothetical protein